MSTPRPVPPPTGRQFELRSGDQHAVAVESGGGIREYAVGGRPVLEPYREDRIPDGAHGTPLIPWPNRLADGAYEWEGETQTLPLTEPEKHNAIHGLMRWQPFAAIVEEPARVVLAARLMPRPGYPFALAVELEYALGPDGLRVATTARNEGATACPYGCGQHPYLSPGEGVLDPCALELPVETRILIDAERELPTGEREAVQGTGYDFRSPRAIGDLKLDDSFTDLRRGEDGLARVRLRGADDRTAELWVDDRYPFLEIFTGDTLAPARARRGLGTEPMTGAPNAFQSGDGLVRLEPGETHVATWGARLI